MGARPPRRLGVVCVLAWALGAALASGQAARSPVVASLADWQSRRLDAEPHRDHLAQSRDGHINTGIVRYGIRYCACTDEAHGAEVVPQEGYIGMPVPSSANWYHSGFLFIELNGQDIGRARLSSMLVADSGQRGAIDLVWHHPVASVRTRFLGLPEDDKLLAEIALEPQTEITSIVVRARCYPSFFTAWHHRDGARRVRTPASLVLQGDRPTLAAADNWWLVYYDEVFDVAKGEGEGPCGMVVLPDEAEELSIDCGSYAVTTSIRFRPDLRRLHLAFWDWTGRPNGEVLATMPDEVAEARTQLEQIDFAPAALREFDLAGARKEVERALASEPLRAQLGERLTQMEAWLQECAPLFAGGPMAPGIHAAERFLQAVDEFRQFSWEVKLAELLLGL